jgi:hypothetical protein
MYLVNLAPLWGLYSYADHRDQPESGGETEFDEEMIPQEQRIPGYFGLEVIPRWWCIPRIVSCLISAQDLSFRDLAEGIAWIARSVVL